MLIVNQDRDKIVNFGNLTQVYITKDEEKIVCFIRFETVDSLYDDLGQYKTEERAKEVLQEIIETYEDCNESVFSTGYGYVKNKVYEGVTVMFYNVGAVVKEPMENMVFYYDDKYGEVAWISLKNANALD